MEQMEKIEAKLRVLNKELKGLDDDLAEVEDEIPEEEMERFEKLCDQFNIAWEETGDALSIVEHLNSGLRGDE
jgi:chromosome segregation ATPase